MGLTGQNEEVTTEPARAGFRRVGRALRLNPNAFRQAWIDPPSMATATAIVAIGGSARGLGQWSSEGPIGLFVSVLLALCLWLVASSLVATLSTYVAPQRVLLSIVLRTCAVAAVPALALGFGALPLPAQVHTALWWAAHFAITLGFVVAVREALRIDTTRALFLSVATLLLGLLGALLVEQLLARMPSL